MSKDDSNGGFLSKVAKFVRHPTTSWSDLDTRSADRESEYSKAALKEMIERKRRNDFVRKREFEMLRKIRSREASGESGQGVRPSFFQSSLPSKPDDRAMTLKKIDEIEAQMSMQWWKTKGPDSLATTGSALNSGAHTTGGTPLDRKANASKDKAVAATAEEEQQAQRRAAQYNETEAASLDHTSNQPGATQPMPNVPPRQKAASTPPAADPRMAKPESQTMPAQSGAASVPATARTGLMVATGQGELASAQPAFSASHFYALDVQEIAQDPEVEEAAIRFANGDDAGAEQGLLDSVGGEPGQSRVEDWLALFDLYRATGQMAPFESQALDFVNRFGRSAPQWFDMPDQVSVMTGKTYQPSVANARAAWVCDGELDAHAVGTLQNVLLRVSQGA